jgi:broad specificity phosphatase PhoE
VTHGGIVSAACHIVTGVDPVRRGVFHVGNCSLTVIERDRTGRLVLTRHNDACHLDGLATAFDTG